MRERAVSAFVEASRWFADVVSRVGTEHLEGPGLGEWNLRQLVAHASRAMSTVTEYLRPAPEGEPPPDDDPVGGAAEYYLSTRDDPGLHRDVAERGRLEALRLGDDLVAAVRAVADQTASLVEEAPEAAVFEARFGTIGFATYLCTRIVELVVHGTDVCAAAGTEPDLPQLPARVTLGVLAELARRRGDTVPVIRALAGRARLPELLSLFS